MPKFPHENLLVGFDTSDDACVYKVREDLAIIQTVDFFPPMVDDPYRFGTIAAANALSDVFAMGGAPTLALNILCFPNCLSLDVLQAIMAGGYDKVKEAGAIVAGGHSIEDDEPKYGLCVTGFQHPDRIWSNATAREGDLLLLTKGLGSGITTTAAKADLITQEEFAPSLDAMSALNRRAKEAAETAEIHACTDITGFGLIGHVLEMAQGSGKTIQLFSDAFPLLPKAEEMAKMGIIPKGAYRNREYVGDQLRVRESAPQWLQDIGFDPQTSGGLLLAVPEGEAELLLERLRESCPSAAIVGQVLAKQDKPVELL